MAGRRKGLSGASLLAVFLPSASEVKEFKMGFEVKSHYFAAIWAIQEQASNMSSDTIGYVQCVRDKTCDG